MTEQDKAASVFSTLTEKEVEEICAAVDVAVDQAIRESRAAGLGDAGIFVAEWIARSSTYTLNLARAMQIPSGDLYKALIEQGLSSMAIDMLTMFAEPTPAAYAKMAEAIASDFLATFSKGAAQALKENTRLH